MERSVFKLLLDALLAADAVLLAYYLRLGDSDHIHAYAGNLPFVAALICFALSLPVLSFMRLNRSLWRYTSLPDMVQIARATTLLLVAFYLLLFFGGRLSSVPRSLPLIHWLLQAALWSAPRVLYRLWHYRERYVQLAIGSTHQKVPVLLVGTGARAELFIRETATRPMTSYRVVGIIDMNPVLAGQSLHGIPIYTQIDRLKDIVASLENSHVRPQKIVIADDAVEGAVMEDLLTRAEALGLGLARLPRQTELKSGAGQGLTVQPIAIEDLLGRSQQVHDRESMRRFIEGKTVLITGAGGTIGSELARQVVSFAPAKLVLFELSELLLYQIHRELKNGIPLVGVLGDVRDPAALSGALSGHKPSIVFHAAAIKHVPIAQENPEEAILTNVCGTRLLAEACKRHGVEAMVLISTDKAVNPTNVMGATKRLAEKICLGEQEKEGTRFVTVRFGNVLGSTGSVVPLFQEQLMRGGPLTVTHKDMERYFMTVREAVELVIQAAAIGQQQGGTYVLDMGKPVKIVTLAEQMIRLAGLKPHQDIAITFTGLRAGEKLTEELFYADEKPEPTKHAAIRHVSQVANGISAEALARLEDLAKQRQAAEATRQLKLLVPEYKEVDG